MTFPLDIPLTNPPPQVYQAESASALLSQLLGIALVHRSSTWAGRMLQLLPGQLAQVSGSCFRLATYVCQRLALHQFSREASSSMRACRLHSRWKRRP